MIGEETQEETGTIDGRRIGVESKHNLVEAKKAVSALQVQKCTTSQFSVRHLE